MAWAGVPQCPPGMGGTSVTVSEVDITGNSITMPQSCVTVGSGCAGTN